MSRRNKSAKKKYSVSEEQKKQFASIYLLNFMINTPKSIPVMLDGNDADLEPVLEYLMMKELIEIKNDDKYVPTENGREALVKFSKKYHDFLRNFDVYCAVDLQEGFFAFEDIIEYSDDPKGWNEYLIDDKWEDLRITVAEYKKLDPVEIVFMSFLNEGNFGRNEEGWQFDLLLGNVWDEIIDICNSALKIDDLGFEDDEGAVSGEDVLQDIMAQAAELVIELIKEAEEKDAENEKEQFCNDDSIDPDDEYYVEEVIVEEIDDDIYYGYRDPFYISPVWLVPIFLF